MTRLYNSQYHKEYKDIDRYVWLNLDDTSLFPIQIDQLELLKRTFRQYGLREPTRFPALRFVDGYGKAPEDQVFEYEVIPQALKDLERKIRNEFKGNKKLSGYSAVKKEFYVVRRFWETLEEEQEKYKAEIEWINLQWYYRLFGKFLFINGKVTYITGGMHWYLNWCPYGNTPPDYRDRDRRWYIGKKWFEYDTFTFKDVDLETKKPIPNEIGEYEMIDLLQRVFFGCNFIKARVVGDTSKVADDNVEVATRTISDEGIGIQGKDDDNAESVFQHNVIHTFTRLPIFWKPIYDGASGVSPKSKILWEDVETPGEGLHMWCDYATSSDAKKYDGRRLLRFHLDEPGKIKYEDVNKINGIVKFCLSTGGGNKIKGCAAYTTTVDEIEEQSAGANYMKLCQNSHYEIRDDNGRTSSGMVNIFFQAADGLAGFIGKYGESIMDKPTPEQALFIGKNIGAKQYIQNTINEYRRKRDWEELALFRRQHPLCFLDCFTPPPKAQVFRRDLIEAQLQRLELHPELKAKRGNLSWKDIRDGIVEWQEDPTGGRFYLSKNMLPGEVNRRIYRDGTYWPVNNMKYVGSPDTFGINKTVSGKGSNGGLVIRYRYDPLVDSKDKDLSLYESKRPILTYRYRPDTVEEYCEDMLKAHVWMSCSCYPERNKTNVIDHFRKRGYEGFLLYNIDRNTGKRKSEPGWWNKDEIVETAIRMLADEIVNNVDRNYHVDLLQEYLEFGGRDYLTFCDLIASELGTLIAELNPYYSMASVRNTNIDCTGMVPGFPDL